MAIFITGYGNLLDWKAEAHVNTVNTVGIMGKGIALNFRVRYPRMFEEYKRACSAGTYTPGYCGIYKLPSGQRLPKLIINFTTKDHWRDPSQLQWIDQGLDNLIKIIQEEGITSICIPPLGCGNGRLDWPFQVKPLIIRKLKDIHDLTIYLWEAQ